MKTLVAILTAVLASTTMAPAANAQSVLATYAANGQQTEVSPTEYLDFATATAEWAWETLEERRATWLERLDLETAVSYAPPSNDLYLTGLNANLFEITGDRKYLERAKQLMLEYEDYKQHYTPEFIARRPELDDALPTLPNVFSSSKYARGFEVLEREGLLTDEERQTMEEAIARSAEHTIRTQEWGAMNRAVLRSESLLYYAKVLPEHPRANTWRMVGESILDDNWGAWQIEDATGYHAIWLYSLLWQATHILEDESLYRTPEWQYYFDYYLKLIAPDGIIPDFGDANYAPAVRMLPVFEKAAAVNGDGRQRWAAAQYFERVKTRSPRSIHAALCMTDAYLAADFDLSGIAPLSGSEEILEDIVGKKIVFRDGWDPTSTYMLLNYRDEGDGGWLGREHLRRTIPVEEEKMHHGNSDENSIVMLMRNRSILLHDGGYRDFMPSGPFGAYRADYFHNRVVIRNGKIALGQKEGERRYVTPGWAAVEGQTLLDFVRNSGAYQAVRTQKIDFLELDRFDVSRTRIINDRLGYEADRIVNYVKDLDWFVVFDVVRFTEPGYLTMANMWHTRQILDSGDGWYQTAYDSLRNVDVSGPERLLVIFPQRPPAHQLVEGTGEQTRHYQKERFMYQLIGRHGYRNDLQSFVTVLVPHDQDESPEELAASITMLETSGNPDAVAVQIERGGRRYIVGAKLDMEAELVRDWRRPMYTYDAGKVRYGPYETDGNNLFVIESPGAARHFAVTNVTRILHGTDVLFEQGPVEFGLAFDGSPDRPDVGKLRYWQESP